MAVTDHALLLRIRAKDEAALAALYDRYGGLVYTLALRIVGDHHLAEEVLQDTFLRCWRAVERYDPVRGRAAAWLMGVARNRSIDLLRSHQHQARLHERETLTPLEGEVESVALHASVSGPLAAASELGRAIQEDGTDVVLVRHVVHNALQQLPSAQRQAIELAYYAGLTQTEIAQRLDAPLGTIKTRIRDGLARLRHLLRPLIEPEHEAEMRHD